MQKQQQHSENLKNFLGPKHWPTWMVYGCIWSTAQLPLSWQMAIGKGLGIAMYHLARSRRHICEVNIALCFPELCAVQQKKLVRDTFISNGRGVMEIGLSWCRDPEDFRAIVTVKGQQHLYNALALGRGVLLISAHFSTLEIAGSLLALHHDFSVTYRRHKNPLFEALMKRGRQRHFEEVIERKEVRKAFRQLQRGKVLWYAADQDNGPRHSVFADFFGRPAASITATTTFASVNKSAVIFLSHYRTDDNQRYELIFSEALQDYPTGDEQQDVLRINALIEAAIRVAPDQYIWLHRRFKTRPEGMPDPYQRKPSTTPDSNEASK